jgi:dTDP-4-dehydrorhamnose 3,5-epimerase
VYKCTTAYAPAHERVIRWDDPDLAIAWPLEGGAPVVSPRDAGGLALRDAPACG